MQQHDRWIARINADRLKAEAEVDALTWEGAKWETFDTQGVEIKEITTGRELRAEGIEMEHCVFSYLDDCVKQRYRVFSLMKDSERATLGVHLDEITHQCHYDQLRGKQNSLTSKVLEQVANFWHRLHDAHMPCLYEIVDHADELLYEQLKCNALLSILTFAPLVLLFWFAVFFVGAIKRTHEKALQNMKIDMFWQIQKGRVS